MRSMATDPYELYAPSTLHFGIAGGSQSKEAAWSVQTDRNTAQTSMSAITLPNYGTVSTQHSLPYWPFQDNLPHLPPTNNLHLQSSDLAATISEYTSGNMIHRPTEDRVDYGSPHIGLSLTQQTYYSPADTATSFNQVFWRSRFGSLFGHQPPRCQVDGCKANLSNAKRYHLRHKVCEFHSKASVVVVGGGQPQRFCQQCSRFHSLDEFDESKKSCRKRLADHNRRRRKQQLSSLSTMNDPQVRNKATHKKKAAPRGIDATPMTVGRTSSYIVSPANNMSLLDGKKTQTTKASSSRIGSAVSFGTVEEQEKPCTSLDNQFNHKEALHVFREEDPELLQLQHQLSAFSQSTYHEAFNSARGCPDNMNYQLQSSLPQNGQLMLGLDFI